MANISAPETDRAFFVETVIQLLESEYGAVRYRPRMDPISELIGTILSQNTSDVNSHRAFESLRQRFKTWEELPNTDTGSIAEAIREGGLGHIKAGRIQEVLRRILAERGSLDLGFLRDMPLNEAKAWLRRLPGVGPKTAAIVLCFSLGLPAMPVDTHVFRVARRLRLVDARATVEQSHGLLEAMVPAAQVYAFHVLLITHGRRTCKARRPMCDKCVLGHICPSHDLFLSTGQAGQ